ncbi:hypothetical protein [Streptacidiphilus fuscans]|uniref:Uncharacterized protein n=1 Tax=Streptacidiphilus fuscans TaxID=2789292 RepID=A0A931BAY9_9ACTN|nr:hypothetical protein [Streptacidiphilus fuscans]MBF9071907.1 hypothetical protein [Streptacidiphilus fuscans]
MHAATSTFTQLRPDPFSTALNNQENLFATEELRARMRRALQQCIREEVEYQDASIGQDELDLMVNIRVWGPDTYELANFDDDELVPAITTIARHQERLPADVPVWESLLRHELQAARIKHQDIKIALGRMRLREDKVRLAELLWPVLRDKCQRELSANAAGTPVLKIALEALDLANRFTGVFALNRPEPPTAR